MGSRPTQTKSMTELETTQFKVEGQPLTENKENDNSSSSSEGEETNANQTGTSDQDNKGTENKDGAGLADHPRWKEREDDWTKRFNEQEKRHVDALEKIREEISTVKPKTESTPTEIPDWFGGDADAWGKYQAYERAKESKIREETLKDFQSKSEAEQKRITEATDYFNGEVASIEGDKTLNPEGLKVDRNKILKHALDNDLVDSKGRWNYKAAFKMMSAKEVFQAKTALNEKREVANATNSENRAESKAQSYATSETFKKAGERPW